MNLDWPWLVVLALAVPLALGHLYHFVVMINIVSGLGYPEWLTHWVRAVLFASLWTSLAYLLWKHLHDPWWKWSGPFWSYAVLCVVSATVIGPLTSVWIACRRQPAGITGSSQILDLAPPEGLAALIGPGKGSWMLHLPRNESFRLRLREWDLAVPDLPDSLDGLHIVQISDLHFAPCFERRYFELLIDACRDWQTDLVVITGDVVEHDDTIAWIEPILGPLEGRLGKFAILGNHDEEHQPRKVIEALGRAGFETLEGRWTTIDVNGANLAIGGTSEPWGPALEPRDMPLADFRLLLSHAPDFFYRARAWGVDLMLSGHNHGGQIRLPVVGPVFMPSRYSRRFDRGFFRRGQTLMYVSEGVSGQHPVRYGCLPEVSRFVLRAKTGRFSTSGQTAHGRRREALERDWVQG